MLILSDYSTQCYSIEADQQSEQQQLSHYQQLCPSIFFGSFNTTSAPQFLVEQRIKVVVTCGPVLQVIRQYSQEFINRNSILMLIVDENFQLKNYNDEELERIMQFQLVQSNLLQEVNNKFTTSTKISVPFITSKLSVTLDVVNSFLKNFKIHYPELSILLDLNENNIIMSTLLLLSYLISINPKSNIQTSFYKLQHLNPKIDSNILSDEYYHGLILKFWESNYLNDKRQSNDKRSLSIGCKIDNGSNNNTNDNENNVNNNSNANDDLKRKRV